MAEQGRAWPGAAPQDIAAWTLVQAGHVVGRRFTAALSEVGLTPTQFGVLLLLDLEPGLAGGEMARRVLVTPQSMSELVASLVELDLVTREDAVPRGHRVATHLTARGQEVLRRAAGVVEAANGERALGLSPDEARTLNGLLHKVIAAGSH